MRASTHSVASDAPLHYIQVRGRSGSEDEGSVVSSTSHLTLDCALRQQHGLVSPSSSAHQRMVIMEDEVLLDVPPTPPMRTSEWSSDEIQKVSDSTPSTLEDIMMLMDEDDNMEEDMSVLGESWAWTTPDEEVEQLHSLSSSPTPAAVVSPASPPKKTKKKKVIKVVTKKRRPAGSSNSSAASSTAATTPPQLSDKQRLQAIYQWYTRCGNPPRDEFLRRLPRGCGVSPDDVHLLPWVEGGAKVNGSALFKLYASTK